MQVSARRGFGLVLAVVAVLMCAQGVMAASSGVVNINTASTDQLAFLPRVGPSVAGRIVEFREQNGKFKDPSDLLLVKGIGDRTFELIEPYVTINGETSLKEKVKVVREGATTGWTDGSRA